MLNSGDEELSTLTVCCHVVNVSSDQGHISCYLSLLDHFSLHYVIYYCDFAIKSDLLLIGKAIRCDHELVQALEKERAV